MRHDEIILVEFGPPKKGGLRTEAYGHQDLEAAQRGKSQRWRRKPEKMVSGKSRKGISRRVVTHAT